MQGISVASNSTMAERSGLARRLKLRFELVHTSFASPHIGFVRLQPFKQLLAGPVAGNQRERERERAFLGTQ
jgi:hypothetical protein